MTADEAQKRRCRAATKVRIARGRMHREPCIACGAEPAEAHHPDYFDHRWVEWLCHGCHVLFHVNVPRGTIDEVLSYVDGKMTRAEYERCAEETSKRYQEMIDRIDGYVRGSP